MKDAKDVKRAAVLGAGTMGAGIAQVCAAADMEVRLHDIDDERAAAGKERVAAFLAKGVSRGKVTEDERDAVLARISTGSRITETVDGADIVIEAVPEKLELKRTTFAAVARVVDSDCLLASNTSSLSIGEIARDLPGEERVVGMHFFNPVPLMKLLEVVRGERTSDGAVDLAAALGRRLGKEPIVVRDVAGFASSRLGIALGLEAIRMVEEEVASAADIDKAMELGYRHPMGPLKLTDLVGLDVRLSIAEHLRDELDDRRFDPPELLRRKVADGELGQKSGRGFYAWDGGDARPIGES